MSTPFNPYWLNPGAAVPVDIETTAALVTEIHRLRQALAQPEQEVLVWMNKYGHVSSTQSEEYNAPLYTPRYNPTINAFDTAPPCQTGSQCIGGKCPECSREWVGLTRKEAEDVVDDFITIGGDVENWVGYWQAIETKLKEKNT